MIGINEPRSTYLIAHETETLVLIVDCDVGRTVTNDAENVIRDLDHSLQGGLRNRRVFYRDTDFRFDELQHDRGIFSGFKACSECQQIFLSDLVRGED